MDWQSEIASNGLAYLIALTGGACVVGLLYAIRPSLLKEIWPSPRIDRAAWTGVEVLAVFVLLIVISGRGRRLLEAAGFFSAWHSEQPPEAANDLVARENLYGALLDMPFMLGLALLILYYRAGLTPADVGLTCWRWRSNLALGVLGYAVGTPLVLGLYIALLLLMRAVGLVPDEHSFEHLARRNLPSFEWGLMFFHVAITAPLIEEFLFRGLLLGWLPRATVPGHLVLSGGVLILGLQCVYPKGFGMVRASKLEPMVFALVLLIGYAALLSWLRTRPEAGDTSARRNRMEIFVAMYGSSMLWAMFHAMVWPSPIALFFMGLGLSWLSWRTQSLVGPIVWHSLFNCVAFLALVFQYVSGPTN
ncbi:MAG: CPBP family intramembrane metalloprotease [Planctomycetes bacterium]|nr:CPBP family intramembrane metalloprotease [Planctomycetota bacterium]